MRSQFGSSGGRPPVVALVLSAMLVCGLAACRKSSSRNPAPSGPSFAGSFDAWQILGGGHATRAMVVGDLDGDLDLDALEVNYGEQNRLLLNNGSASLTDGTDLDNVASTGLPARSDLSRAAVLVDVDGDGDLDIVIGNNGQNTLLRNNGSGSFDDVTDPGNVLPQGLPAIVDDTYALAAFDCDGDGDQDLFVGNTGQNQLLLNNGSGEFFIGTDLAGTLTTGLPAITDNTRDVAVRDLDGDLDLDLVVANDGAQQDRILINDINNAGTKGEFADGTFSGLQGLPLQASNSRAVVVRNFDGTGGDDLFFVGDGRPRLLLNNGNGFFTDASTTWAREAAGAGQINTWRSVMVDSGGNLTAVGTGGQVGYSTGGGNWGATPASPTTNDLYGVHGDPAGNTNVFAVGLLGTIHSFNGSTWSTAIANPAQQNLAATPPYVGDNLNDVYVVPINSSTTNFERWAVGDRAMILKSTNGTTWTQVTGTDNPVYTAPVVGPPAVGPMGPNLNAVWGITAATDTLMFAVGQGGTILRKANGATAWTQLQTAGPANWTARDLYGIWGDPTATTLITVGQGGTILRSTDGGTNWTNIPSGVNQDLFEVHGTGASVWAVGRAGTVLMSTDSGASWSVQNPGTNADFYAGVAQAASPSQDFMALGLVGTIVRDTAGSTTAGFATTPPFLDAYDVVVVNADGDSDDDVIVAVNGQNRFFENNGSGLFSDQTATVLPTQLDDSRGVSLGVLDAGALADLLTANVGQNRLALGQTGGSFTDSTSGPSANLPLWLDARDAQVGDVTGDGAPDIVVAVNGAQNRLFVRAGTGFIDGTAGATTGLPVDTDPSESVNMIDIDGDNDFDLVFGNRGTQNKLYRNNGSGQFTDITATNLPVDTDPTVDIGVGDVDGQNGPDLFFTNDGAQNNLLLNNGSGVFTVSAGAVPAAVNPSQDVALAHLDNDNNLDAVVANAGAWQADTAPTGLTNAVLYSVSAVAANDIWAVGEDASGDPVVIHYNGTAWARDAAAETAAGGSASGVALRSVFALTATDVIAVGDGGTIVRFDGTNWSDDAGSPKASTNNLYAVGGTGAADLHAVGDSGTVLRNTGAGGWTLRPQATTANLRGLYALSSLSAVAVGTGTQPVALVWNGTFWATLAPPGTPSLAAVGTVNGTNFLAVGAAGTVLRHDGQQWIPQSSPTGSNINGVGVNTVGGTLVVGGAGFASRDVGKGFVNETTGVSVDLHAVTWINTTHAVAVGAAPASGAPTILRWRGVQNTLLINNGTGGFSDSSANLPVDDDVSMDVALADVDLDGDLDLVWGNARGQNRLSLNNGLGVFGDGTDLNQVLPTGIEAEFDDTRAVMFISARGTQWDIVTGNFEQQNRLLLNQGGGEFEDGTDAGNVSPFGLVPDRAPTYAIKQGDFDFNGARDVVFVNGGGCVILLHR